MIMAILLIRQIDRACRSRKNSAPSEGFESRGIVRECAGSAVETDDSYDSGILG
jgi:hypothetical protein